MLFALSVPFVLTPILCVLGLIGLGVVGNFTTSIQTKVDNEQYVPGNYSGTYSIAQKLQETWTVIGSTTPISLNPFTIPATLSAAATAGLQMYEFSVDQGTGANPVVVVFTSNTGNTVQLKMVAGQIYYFDISQMGVPGTDTMPYGGIFSGAFTGTTWVPFGTSVVSATYNIPSALAVTTVNFTGRICSLS
jgi:hypothetical protein